MAKKKEPEAGDPATWKEAPPVVMSHPEDIELDEVFSGLPETEACIELFRINSQGGRPLFLEAVQPAVFSLTYVLNRFGGGRYMAYAKYKTGERVKHPFEIEGDPLPVRRLGPGGGVEPISTPQPAQMPKQWLQESPSSQEIEPMPSDTASMFSVLVALIKDMKTSKADMYKEMLMLKELFGSNQPAGPQATIDQVTQMLMKGIELAGKAGTGGETNIWIELARELKEPLGKGLDALQMALAGRQQTPQPVAVPPPIGHVTTPTQEQPANEGASMNMAVLTQLRAVLPLLINGAAKNSDPQMYVDLILDQIPESLYPSLRDWLIRPDCLDMLAKLEPGIRYQQEWWTSLRSVFIEALTEEVGNGLTAVQPTENTKPTTGGAAPSGPAA